jgi:hypothetical protein
LFTCLTIFAQIDSGNKQLPETTSVKPATVIKKKPVIDSLRKKDSLIKTLAVNDTLPQNDSLLQAKALLDSLQKDSVNKIIALQKKAVVKDTSTYSSIWSVSTLPLSTQPLYMLMKERKSQSQDELFYLLASMLLFLAIIKLAFPRYFQSLFKMFVQTSFRQKQTKDILLQNNLPSLLMNMLFIITGGIYIGLMAYSKQFTNLSFWWLLLYCSALLLIIYTGKFLFLRFSGWVFNAKEVAGNYVFIVFFVNKILSVLLIPFILIIAFSSTQVAKVTVTVSLIVVAILFLYRYITSLATIKKDLKISPWHFVVYLFAIEILPLMLMYKLLFNYIEKSV